MPSLLAGTRVAAAAALGGLLHGGLAMKLEDGPNKKVEALMHGPASGSLKYNLTRGSRDGTYSQDGQDIMIKKLLCPLVEKGFFVESGAVDGERHSNTLGIEMRCKGWTGLLVEPDPVNFGQLLTKNRKSHAFNGCLSPSGAVEELEFSADVGCFGNMGECGHIENEADKKQKSKTRSFPVTCAPLHMLLKMLGQKTVDFWSLDIEGAEAMVLRGTNFKEFEVGVILIEMDKNAENNKGIMEVMDKEGFKEAGATKRDHVFVNPAYFTARGFPVPEKLDLATAGRA